MPKVAKPYQEGAGWSMRKTYKGERLYVSGKPSVQAARRAMTAKINSFSGTKKPFGLGSQQTTLGQALQDWACDHLPRLKGAPQERDRINRYVRAAGLDTLDIEVLGGAIQAQAEESAAAAAKGGTTKKRKPKRWKVLLVPSSAHEARRVPQGLHQHRGALERKSEGSDRIRALLAHTMVGQVTRYQLQQLVYQMENEGAAPATIHLERAMLRGFFNHAHTVWNWSDLQDNQATGLDMPEVDNIRKRYLTEKEKQLIAEAMEDCRNVFFEPSIKLLHATAMRTSEPLKEACWKHVDWDRRILTLPDSKTGSGEVPLNQEALEALRSLQALGNGGPDEKIVAITYEALKAGFRRVCERAGVENLQLYDLRRDAATKLALETGNIFMVQSLTRHKTIQMAQRYVATGAEHLVTYWEEKEAAERQQHEQPMSLDTPSASAPPERVTTDDTNVVRVDFAKRQVRLNA
jgi:integrase